MVGQAESTTSEVAGTRSAVLSTVQVTARTLCKGVVRRVVAQRTRSSRCRAWPQRARRLVGRWRWRCKQREVRSLFTVEPLHVVVVLGEIGPGKVLWLWSTGSELRKDRGGHRVKCLGRHGDQSGTRHTGGTGGRVGATKKRIGKSRLLTTAGVRVRTEARAGGRKAWTGRA